MPSQRSLSFNGLAEYKVNPRVNLSFGEEGQHGLWMGGSGDSEYWNPDVSNTGFPRQSDSVTVIFSLSSHFNLIHN